MFPPMQLEHDELVLRPMNCPHHILVYETQLHSYRDLPLRIAEFGTMYRFERSGVVGGLSRVRAMSLTTRTSSARRTSSSPSSPA